MDKKAKSIYMLGFPGGAVVKKLPANTGNVENVSSIPGLGRSPRGGSGNPLQYSCLKNSTARRAWQATVHGVTKSQIWLSDLAHIYILHTRDQLQTKFSQRMNVREWNVREWKRYFMYMNIIRKGGCNIHTRKNRL